MQQPNEHTPANETKEQSIERYISDWEQAREHYDDRPCFTGERVIVWCQDIGKWWVIDLAAQVFAGPVPTVEDTLELYKTGRLAAED